MIQPDDNPYRSPSENDPKPPEQRPLPRSRRLPSPLWALLFLLGPMILAVAVLALLELAWWLAS